jgi:hypothetical protein
MKIFNLFKCKEKKENDLESKVIELNEKYKDEIDCFCKIGNYIFVFRGFKQEKGKIHVRYVDKETIPGYTSYAPLWLFEMKHEFSCFKEARFEFIKFKNDLNKLGLKLEKL